MARDEEVKGRAAARSVRTVGHAASGGHSKTLTIQNRWRREPGDPHNHGGRVSDWQEYPMMIYPDSPDGSHAQSKSRKGVIVNSEAERDTLLGGQALLREPEERTRLIKVAEVKGVQIDKRWGLDRITAAIVDAGFDPDLNPFE